MIQHGHSIQIITTIKSYRQNILLCSVKLKATVKVKVKIYNHAAAETMKTFI